MRRLSAAAALILSVFAAGCMVGPDYQRPEAPPSPGFKELNGWKPAQPRDDTDKGDWWAIYHDPELDRLERMVEVSNQTVKQFEAEYRNAVALVGEARAGLFPHHWIDRKRHAHRCGGGGSSGTARNSSNLGSRAVRPAVLPAAAEAAAAVRRYTASRAMHHGPSMCGAVCGARSKATSPVRRSAPRIWRMPSCRRKQRWQQTTSICARKMRWSNCCVRPRTPIDGRCRLSKTNIMRARPRVRTW